jgi:hypothetical protein
MTSHYLCHPHLAHTGPVYEFKDQPDTLVLATSVSGNMAMHPCIPLPILMGIVITADDVRRAGQIYGPVRAHVQGSATSVQDVAITTELPQERSKPVPQSLAIDLCKILGSWFLVGIFLPCHYLSVSRVPHHTATAILEAVKKIVEAAAKRETSTS